MKLPLLLLSLVILVGSNALPLGEDAQPRCIKIDECSCRLKNVKNPGLINLHGLVSDKHEPRFTTEGRSQQTGSLYSFYYNPCMNFSDLGCPNTSLCQRVAGTSRVYDLGNLDTIEFEYQNSSVVAVYKSKSQHPDGLTRISEVELVCDETELLGRFVFVEETIQVNYKFKLYTQCACPGRCKASKVECVSQDLCTCEMSDGTGTINLHALDSSSTPMKDELDPMQTIFYNPCSPVKNPNCGNHSVCKLQGDSVVGLGIADTARFMDNKGLSIEYLGNVGSPSSTVNLICDYSQRDRPFFRADKSTDTYNVYSVCACPDGCDTPAPTSPPTPPPPIPTCDQIDSCTCKTNFFGIYSNQTINLHEIDNRFAPLTTTDQNGYTYYYNPCSGLELKIEEGKCDGVAACQEDPFAKTYYNLGKIGPKIDYDYITKMFTFHYTGGDGSRSFDVKMVCDPKADKPILTTDGDIPYGEIFYPLKLTTKLACF